MRCVVFFPPAAASARSGRLVSPVSAALAAAANASARERSIFCQGCLSGVRVAILRLQHPARLLGSRAKPDISLLALSKVLSLWQGHNSRIRKKRDNASRSLLPETRARVAPGPLLDVL